MITITGKSVFGGVSIGKLSFYKKKSESDQKRTHERSVESECVKISGSKSRGDPSVKRIVRKIDCRCRRSQRYDF